MFELLSRTIDKKKSIWSKEKISSNQRVFDEWERGLVNEYGPTMITLAKPYSFKNQKLIVTVRNSIIACEIQAKKEKIKNAINKIVGERESIKEIIIRIG
jgi:hypothetical protein